MKEIKNMEYGETERVFCSRNGCGNKPFVALSLSSGSIKELCKLCAASLLERGTIGFSNIICELHEVENNVD